jgi:hypothetical protein
MMKWTCIMVILVAGCNDPTGVLSDDPDESVSTEETGETGETTGATDETDGTGSETTGSVSDTGSGSGSATVDTGSSTVDTGSATGDSGSGTGDSDTVPPCWLSCMSSKSECQLGSVVLGRCPNAEWCCEPKAVDTETGTGTGTGVPCPGTCANSASCGGDWHEIAGDCPQPWQACCEKDTDTGSATVDTDTNPQPCPVEEYPKYRCERRVLCLNAGGFTEDTDYVCPDPGNYACCWKIGA